MIPVSKPTITSEDVRLVTDAVSSGWVSSQGAYIERFEREFADFCGVRHCVATSNGTVAIHLALKVLNIGRGDEVIVPDLTFVATANSVILAEATPVIADVRLSDWCLDPKSVESLITPRTRAIIPVHLFGHPAAMDELRTLAQKYDLKIIEDAAEAHGAEYQGRKVGGLGDCATFSFYGNKIIQLAFADHASMGHDADAITDFLNLLKQMARHEHRNAAFFEAHDQVADLTRTRRVHPCGRFIKNDEARFMK
jgi:perosamine synthetase